MIFHSWGKVLKAQSGIVELLHAGAAKDFAVIGHEYFLRFERLGASFAVFLRLFFFAVPGHESLIVSHVHGPDYTATCLSHGPSRIPLAPKGAVCTPVRIPMPQCLIGPFSSGFRIGVLVCLLLNPLRVNIEGPLPVVLLERRSWSYVFAHVSSTYARKGAWERRGTVQIGGNWGIKLESSQQFGESIVGAKRL